MKRGRQGEGGGRPPKYANSKELDKRIDEYFVDCKERAQIPNKAGICLFLGITKETYCQYREKFADSIKAADFMIENAWVQRLAGNSPTGAIFYLKNAFKNDYKEKTETDLTSRGEKILGIEYIIPKNEKSKD